MTTIEPAIWFPAIRAESGIDIYTHQLVDGLNRRGVRAEIAWLPHRAEYAPWMVKIPNPPSWANIIQVNSWISGRLLANEFRLVVTVHHVVHDSVLWKYEGLDRRLYHRLWIKRLEDQLIRRADKVIAVSNYTAQRIRCVFGHQEVTVIPNSVDTNRFRPGLERSPGSPFRLLFVGNWSRRKGADLLPKIMANLGAGFELHIAGPRRNVVHLTHDKVVKHGRIREVGDLVRLYQQCDALLFPTRLEGFGLVALEAHACGRPVIATRCSSLPEVVEDGVSGLLCQPEDVQSFADAARYLAANPELWRRMGAAARARAETHFTIDKMIDLYIKCYRQALAGH